MTQVRSSSRTTTVREQLLQALVASAEYNAQDVVEPVAILWPDEFGAWADVVRDLGSRLVVITLGEFDESARQGPAQWLRIQIAASASDSTSSPLVVYLPGVSRRQLTDPTQFTEAHRPLAGLAFRSAVFAQRNGSDWTPAAFFSNRGHGLGLEIAQDADSRAALAAALPSLLDTPVSQLQGQRLTASVLNQLAVGDEVREILRWLDKGDDYQQAEAAAGRWTAFANLLRKHYKIHPEQQGVLAAAEALGRRQGPWAEVWDRYREAPGNYPNIPDLLRRAKPQSESPVQLVLGSAPSEMTWPQDNDAAENGLTAALSALGTATPKEIRSRLQALESEHAPRRSSVWADLEMAPLANALAALVELSGRTVTQPVGTDAWGLADSYTREHYRADAAFLEALASLPHAHAGSQAVQRVAECLYRPWLEASTATFQDVFIATPSLNDSPAGVVPDEPAGTCALFVDGLRFDVGAQLASDLQSQGASVDLAWGLADVPTVTSTCKPAVTPVAAAFSGGAELTPRLGGNGSVYSQPVLRKALGEAGWQEFGASETGDPKGRGWTEGGNIDSQGHSLGAKLAHQIPNEVRGLATRIQELIAAGWSRIVVVTDHGWLLLPGKLPKADLPEHLAQPRKGRCARLADGAATPAGARVLPWRWDSNVRIALAPGIHAYEAGKAYEHGGLSLQESVVPRLVVTAPSGGPAETESGPMIDLQWTGLALKVRVVSLADDVQADLRFHAGDATSSLLGAPKALKNGKARLLVDDELAGSPVVLVLLDALGNALAHRPTTVPAG